MRRSRLGFCLLLTACGPSLAPMANLPTVIFQFALSPYADWQRLAWAGVLLITLAVLGFNVLARVVTRRKPQTTS